MSVDWQLTFQGFKTLLDPLAAASWPIAIGIIAWIFKAPVEAMIGRVRHVSGFGGIAEFAPREASAQQQSVGASAAKSLPTLADTNNLPPSDPIFDVLDAQLAANLAQHIGGDERVKLAWAIRQRSVSEANRLHETNYRLIFGSQVTALKALNVIGQGSISDFEAFYDSVAKDPAWEAIHRGRTFEKWGEFLINTGYTAIVDGSDPPSVHITPFGRQFLQWLVLSAVPEIKPG